MTDIKTRMKPIYEQEGIVLYNCDCREILPQLPKVDLVLTDPPYGIKADCGVNNGGVDGFGRGIKRNPNRYTGGWDAEKPATETLLSVIASGAKAIVWGGNYFADVLPVNGKWLVWDKVQTMPTYSDAELAWTNLDGVSVKMFRYNGSGLMAKEKDRVHPTQKPLSLMLWCLGFFPSANTILDPFAGSGTTGVAAKQLGRKCIPIEREPKYCDIIIDRLAQNYLPLNHPPKQPEQMEMR